MTTNRFSATVDAELLAELRKRVDSRELSSFVSRALRHELDRVSLRELLETLEVEVGPPDEAMVAQAGPVLDELATAARRRSRRGSAA